jgi:hypothetical protein
MTAWCLRRTARCRPDAFPAPRWSCCLEVITSNDADRCALVSTMESFLGAGRFLKPLPVGGRPTSSL